MIKLDIKPFSINEAWMFKQKPTKSWVKYKTDLYKILPPYKINKNKLFICFEFGLSNIRADYDNYIKITQDVIADKYGFNDFLIQDAFICKVKTLKGNEYIKFAITDMLSNEQKKIIMDVIFKANENINSSKKNIIKK